MLLHGGGSAAAWTDPAQPTEDPPSPTIALPGQCEASPGAGVPSRPPRQLPPLPGAGGSPASALPTSIEVPATLLSGPSPPLVDGDPSSARTGAHIAQTGGTPLAPSVLSQPPALAGCESPAESGVFPPTSDSSSPPQVEGDEGRRGPPRGESSASLGGGDPAVGLDAQPDSVAPSEKPVPELESLKLPWRCGSPDEMIPPSTACGSKASSPPSASSSHSKSLESGLLEGQFLSPSAPQHLTGAGDCTAPTKSEPPGTMPPAYSAKPSALPEVPDAFRTPPAKAGLPCLDLSGATPPPPLREPGLPGLMPPPFQPVACELEKTENPPLLS
mmetsp:Transcript_16714/g.50401  ORF Transcript_16714/g.50401 Transcript_16714/m.50401 type:complete len:330 (-) Transcript_16714:101-1090(-)